jgi:hypothetical protein
LPTQVPVLLTNMSAFYLEGHPKRTASEMIMRGTRREIKNEGKSKLYLNDHFLNMLRNGIVACENRWTLIGELWKSESRIKGHKQQGFQLAFDKMHHNHCIYES